MTHDASTIAGGSAPESDEGMSFAEMLAQQEQSEDSRVRLEPGQRVSARVVAVTGDTVFVSTGSKVDGIVDRAELEKDGALSCQVGDSLDLYVITANAQEVKLSRSMSGDGSLAVLEDARDARLPVEGKVSAQVKGGYSVDIMKRRAFCPMSQIDIRPPADPGSVLGQTYAFLITKLESHGRNIVVSRRDLLERERGEALTLLLEEMHEGDLREGVVSRLAPFGAFIELAPGVEGMAHLSELSWSRVDHAEDAVKLGDTVRVKVLTIAREAKGVRISLSLKAAMDDPWNTLGDSLATGDTVTGKVVRLTSFGAFVELLPGVEGLVHLSELSFAKRVAKAEEIVSVGDIVSVRIKEIDNDRRRVSLSLKDAAGNPWDNVGDALSVNAEREGSVEKRAPFGLFITLAPGITGLLANQVISASPQRKTLEKLNPGDKIMVRIRDIDSVKRRVSLAPAGEEDAAALSEDWKQHAPKKESAPSLGALGLALQAAQAKRKHKPERFSPS